MIIIEDKERLEEATITTEVLGMIESSKNTITAPKIITEKINIKTLTKINLEINKIVEIEDLKEERSITMMMIIDLLTN